MSNLVQQLKIYEQKISRNNYETAYLFNPNGDILFKKRGSFDAVLFSGSQLAKMPGNILTHNHPYDKLLEQYGITSTMSSKDISLAYQRKLFEFRMVFGNERHSIKWSNASLNDAQDFINRLQLLEVGINATIDRVIENLYKGKYITGNEYYSDYCAAVKKHTTDINAYIERNSVIGYVFNREG